MKSTEPTRRPSSRFEPGPLTRYLIPAILGLLTLALLATLALIVLSLLGITPGVFPW